MGLSASQARLLSITQRLSDNELHSEILANSKMRLADESIIAKNNYVNALNSTKLEYVGFDGYGNANNVDLTFNSLMTYSEIKNQNILKNNNGQVLISDTDAYNYETSTTMYDFLNKYGLYDSVDYGEQFAALEAWEQAYQEYLTEHDYWQNVLMPAYYEELANSGGPNEKDVYQKFANIVGTSDDPNNPAKYCYANAINSSSFSNCYKHVLMYLLYPINDGAGTPESPETLTTSLPQKDGDGNYIIGTNVTITPIKNDWQGSILNSVFIRENIQDENGNNNQLLPVYEAMLDEITHLCDGDDNLNIAGSQNIIQTKIDAGEIPNDADILMSDYIYDAATNTCGGLKSLRQKAIDMLELIKNPRNHLDYTGSMPADIWAAMQNLMINFTDGDMRGLADIERPEEPLFTQERPSLPTIKCDDKSKTQWYINLWYAIDGQENPNELKAIYDEDGSFSYYTIEDAEKQTTYLNGQALNPSFKIVPDELRSDANWLQHALANGIVTLNQVILDSNKNELVWSGFEYTSTSSFNEVTDDKKIAKAEAEYQSEMKRIETEDSKIDMKIKKLDTEHNALKTEYDSIAQLIGKNIERSYNTFNA